MSARRGGAWQGSSTWVAPQSRHRARRGRSVYGPAGRAAPGCGRDPRAAATHPNRTDSASTRRPAPARPRPGPPRSPLLVASTFKVAPAVRHRQGASGVAPCPSPDRLQALLPARPRMSERLKTAGQNHRHADRRVTVKTTRPPALSRRPPLVIIHPDATASKDTTDRPILNASVRGGRWPTLSHL